MNEKYIYNQRGEIEYVLVPYIVWQAIQGNNQQNAVFETGKIDDTAKFDAAAYQGIFEVYPSNFIQEFEQMRDEWQ